MINTPLISVILPVYNAEKYVSRAIESILCQSYKDFELLIIDDASTDNSIEIISSFKDNRIKLFHNTKNLGSLLSRNYLFERVRGDFIAFQDADDISILNRLDKQISFFNDHPEYGLVGSWIDYIDNKGKHLLTAKKPVTYPEIVFSFKDSIPIVFSSSMARAEVLEKVGLFRPFFADKGNYDYDWMFRICEKYSVANIPEVLYKTTLLPESNSKRIVNPAKIIGDKLVQFFANERAILGYDSLMKEDFGEIQGFIQKSLLPYEKDRSLFFKERAEALFSFRAFKLAMKAAIKAILKNPVKVKNYRTLFYIFRKSLRSTDF